MPDRPLPICDGNRAGRKIEPSRFAFTEWLFVRALAVIYLIAFASAGVQIRGLIGSRGILPLSGYLAALRQAYGISSFWIAPSVFWWNSSDGFLTGACIAGAVISLILITGFAQRSCLALLFVLYLSICTAGQDFLSFQWDMLLLEAGFLAIFLGSSKLVVWLFRWLLFRLMFLSGLVKLLSHDQAWRSLDALRYHYWTQPLPTPVAWYMNQLPAGFQRASTAGVFVIELLAPFLVFFPRWLRFFGAACLILLQVLILISGNYAFFNWLTLALCLFLFDDRAFGDRALPWGRSLRTNPVVALAVFALVAVLSGSHLVSTFAGWTPGLAKSLLRVTAPFGIVNSYGLFAVMTTSRPEIIVQGSQNGTDWRDYEFRYKPGELRRAPPWVAPHQPRLDWQMWFAALSDWRSNPWFTNFMARLLEGSPEVLKLLEKNPFPDQPPRFVRALVYDYTFASANDRREKQEWWSRELKGSFFPAISLESVRTR